MATGENRSIGELFSDLSRDIGTLVRKELELLKSELSTKVIDARASISASPWLAARWCTPACSCCWRPSYWR